MMPRGIASHITQLSDFSELVAASTKKGRGSYSSKDTPARSDSPCPSSRRLPTPRVRFLFGEGGPDSVGYSV
jgi:hypothetical protein